MASEGLGEEKREEMRKAERRAKAKSEAERIAGWFRMELEEVLREIEARGLNPLLVMTPPPWGGI